MTAPEDGLIYSVDGAVVMRVGAAWYGRAADGQVVDFYATARDCVRPLVVIDPEDREQVERLYHLYYGGTNQDQPVAHLLDQMQAALREFAQPKPVKPDEPLGLGAVVEDAEGRKWVRTADVDCMKPWCYANNYSDCDYSEVPAVRVLSEGVTL